MAALHAKDVVDMECAVVNVTSQAEVFAIKAISIT